MAIYPVGTPSIFRLTEQSAVQSWTFPTDYPFGDSGSGVGLIHRTATIAKPAGVSFFYMAAYDLAYVGGTWANFPAFGFRECNVDASTIAGGSAAGLVNAGGSSRLLVPSSVDAASTPYAAWNQTPFIQLTQPSLSYLVGVGNWGPGDSGGVVLMGATTANASLEPWLWNGPYTIDCGSGPNRVTLIEYCFYHTQAATTAVNVGGLGATSIPAYVSAQLQPPAATQQLRQIQLRKRFLVNPPTGVANLTFAWNGPVRGLVAVSTYAGVNQTSPIATTANSTLNPPTNATTQTLTTPTACPVDGYWVSDLIAYDSPVATPAAGQGPREMGNLGSSGLVTLAVQRGAGAGAAVTTTWNLDRSVMGAVTNVFLAWDGVTVAPTISQPAYVAIVG